MALKAIVSNLNEVPESVREHYEETDDGYALKLEGWRKHPEIAKVKESADKAQQKLKDVADERDKLKKTVDNLPEDFDPDEYERLRANGNNNQDLQAKIDEARDRERKRWEKKLQDEQQAREKAEQSARNLTTKQALKEGLDSINVASKLRRAAERVWMTDVEIDDDGNPVTKDGRPLQDALKEWADSEEGQHFIAAPSSGGGGAAGGRGAAKGKKLSEMSESEVRQLYQRDPAEYRRLRDQEKA